MLYLEYNDDGTIAREAFYDPPLQEKQIGVLANGKPRFVPLIVAPAKIDPETEKGGPYQYQTVGKQVRKIQTVIVLDADERKKIQTQKALEQRRGALPEREHEMELIYDALAALVDFCAMLETKVNTLDLSQAEVDEIRNRRALLKAVPIPQ